MNPIKHVAIIMDGNGRWGVKHKKSRNLGHKQGLKTVEKIIKFSIKQKIKYLTLFAFSTENWKRPKREINFLFNLLENFLIQNINKLQNQKIKIKIIGKKKFNKKLNKLLNYSEKLTSNNKLKLEGGGNSKRNFIYVEDVVNATYKIALKGKTGETYHISSNQIRSIILSHIRSYRTMSS